MNTDESIKVLLPGSKTVNAFMSSGRSVRHPFSDEIIQLLDVFSRRLFKNNVAKTYPDLQALAFWMRKSQIIKLKNTYQAQTQNKVKVGRGVVFHIAPSNVDTIFIYSLILSMLCGNRNIIRISSSNTDRQNVLLEELNYLVKEQFPEFSEDILVINYAHNEEITSAISKHADVRVIWGGDNTIEQISRCVAKPSTLDMKFANKYSYALIDVNALETLKEDEFENLAGKFVNDAYWFGQQACSSPRTVLWNNPDKKNQVIEKFWSVVEAQVMKFQHDIEPADIMNKLVAQQQLAIEHTVHFKSAISNLVTRVNLQKITERPKQLHCGAGLFYEIHISSLEHLKGEFSRNDQTMSYFGIDLEQLKSVLVTSPEGIDRVVPLGTALEFSPVWDGYDFLQYLTREIEFKV